MQKICLSRTDSIGDVVLTLPLVGYIREKYPQAKILFLGRTYTQPIIELCKEVDEFINFDDLEALTDEEIVQNFKERSISHFVHVFPNKRLAFLIKKAGIPNRIGTSHRLYHLRSCNRRVNFTRKRSDLHESQLNFHLMKHLGLEQIPSLDEVNEYLQVENSKRDFFKLESFGLSPEKKIVILHPKSQGSAVEWGVGNFIKLVELLKDENVQIVITGTEKESTHFRSRLPDQDNLFDLSGKMTLTELISLIERAEILVAASTGPLHIAGILDIGAIGLFSPRRPIHPGRWKPLGRRSEYVVHDPNCMNCQKGEECDCISKINPEKIQMMIKGK